jgi:hypothetical protein
VRRSLRSFGAETGSIGVPSALKARYRFSGEPRFQWLSRYSPGSGAESK